VILVYIVLGAIAILVLVTRAAGKRDAARKAQLEREARGSRSEPADERPD